MPFEMTGMDELLKRLERLGKTELAKQAALDAGAEHLRSSYAKNLPRSKAEKSHAADHIIMVPADDDPEKRLIGPDKDHFYLRFDEWGHDIADGKHVAPNPVMEQTFHAESKATEEIMRAALKKGMGL